MGVPSLNDLAVDGTLNTTNQPTHSKAVKMMQFQYLIWYKLSLFPRIILYKANFEKASFVKLLLQVHSLILQKAYAKQKCQMNHDSMTESHVGYETLFHVCLHGV